MNIPRDPDLSIPPTVQGNLLSDVLIPPPDEDKVRNENIEKSKRSKEKSIASFIRNMTLDQQLSYSMVLLPSPRHSMIHHVTCLR